MNILEEIRNCPVEWKELGEVAFLKRGKAITSKTATDGPYPVISGGQKPAYLHGDFNREGETITVAGSGAYAGFVMYWNEPIFVSDAFSIKPFDRILSSKFLYYYLLEIQGILFSLKKGSGVPHVYPKDVSRIFIPIPPLEIQEKIVQILDKFTDYVTELTSELTSRKKQYSYYRDKLLSFEDEVYQVEWKKLNECLKKGKGTKITASQMKLLHKDGAPIRIFAGGKTYADVNYGDIPDKDIHTEEAIIVKSRGIIDFEYCKKPFSFKNEFWSYSSNNESINLRYVYHYLVYNKGHFQNIANNMQMPQISSNDTEKFKIPVPSLEIQSRIVQVLDNFDTVCNDLNIGLPGEIELRQKQYEYFREKLLTFVAEGEYTESRVEEWDNSAIIKLLQWVFGPIRVKVGQVVNLQRGKRLVRKQLTTSGSVPVYQNSLAPLGYYTESNRVKNTSFVICAGAAGEIGYSAMDFWAADDVYTLATSDNISDKFMYYVLLSKQDRLKSQVRKASIPRLSKDAIDKVTFYLPPFSEQKRIVSILDNFNTLTNSLSEGLPKEIELRQKQYEYWREQLLNFTR
ncbi:restriction endonuclease subunit S [Streptococcus mitis]|uniref:restriction endonuclease subunit S n=2 Tax=Streptococcus mitis TaxID=28037 RepID=UPI001BE46CBB|nr:restriction endonuclease subunit S [Streptococcus mitis]MBT2174944.1 restriction endonuclease subunit S [Streptococcus mitis]